MSVTLPDVAPLTIDDITSGSVTGTGIFDKLMATVAAQLQSEFQADRITKSDYGQVYVSALNATLAQAIQFLLTKDQAAIQAATLIGQYEKIALEKQQLQYQNDLLIAQKAQLELQNEKLVVEKDVILLQKDQLAAQITQLGVQSAQIQQQTLLIASQILSDEKQRDLITNQITLINSQTQTDQAQRNLINQKTVTEAAQTQDGYAGIVGQQKSLYAAQTTGFTRDAEQKAAKLALDILATQLSTDDSMTVENTNMHPAAIGAMVQKLADGIGVTIPSV